MFYPFEPSTQGNTLGSDTLGSGTSVSNIGTCHDFILYNHCHISYKIISQL